jgi:hypothetical protein
MIKKNWVKKIEKGDIVTIFWYTLKNLHLVYLDHKNLQYFMTTHV